MYLSRHTVRHLKEQVEDLNKILKAGSKPESEAAFNEVFGTEITQSSEFGSASNSMDEGFYFRMYSDAVLYLLIYPSEDQLEALGIEECLFAVYRDRHQLDGPYAGNAEPIGEVHTFVSWAATKTEFAFQVKYDRP